MRFEELEFDERIQKGIDEAGFKTPMPVQVECFQLLIKNHRDIYAQSQTGTGKTAAFLLAIFQLLVAEEKYSGQKALIVAPTRELAIQIEREGKLLGKYLTLKFGSVYGGVGYGAQEKMLERGVDILVGTPGRLIDFNKQRKLSFKDFRFLVIDEADRLFDMGFLPDLRKILKGMKPSDERHTLLFSATLNPRVGNLAWEYMNNPGEVIIEPEKKTVDTVTQELYHVGKDEKLRLLLGILQSDNPVNAVIFTNTRHSAWEVAKRMEINGYSVVSLMGDLPQKKRLRIVDEVKNGRLKYLVATDVAARGLHIDGLEMVINYDVPLEPESYVHRIGRTARVGRTGKTITMACEEFVYGLGPIERLLGEKIPVRWADESFLVDDKSAGLSFPPQVRHREMAGGHNNRRSPRAAKHRADNRQEKDVRHEGKRRAPGSAGGSPSEVEKKSIAGKKPLDPKTIRIQSTITSIAGGSIAEFGKAPDDRQKRAKKRSQPRASQASKPAKQKSANGKSQKTTVKKPPETMQKPWRIEEHERVSSDSSIDERLDYYRKKYGENFQLDNRAESSDGRRKNTKKVREPGGENQSESKKGLISRLFGK